MSGATGSLRLALDYRVQTGWLGPHLDALAAGKAIARRCDACGRTTFPPRRRCACGEAAGTWVDLAGSGTLVAATTGPGVLPLSETTGDLTFALIAMDGADNLTVGRLAADAGQVGPGDRVQLTAGPAHTVPWQAGQFVPTKNGT